MLSREEMLWFQACCRSTGMIFVASTETQGGGAPTLPFHGRWLSVLGGEGGSVVGLGHPSRAAGTGEQHGQLFENCSRNHKKSAGPSARKRDGVCPGTCCHPPDLGLCFGVSTLRATKVMPTSSSFSPSECSCFSTWDSTGTTTGSEHTNAQSQQTASQRGLQLDHVGHRLNNSAPCLPPMSHDRILLSCQLTFRLGLSPPSSLTSDPRRWGTEGTPVSQWTTDSQSECPCAICA